MQIRCRRKSRGNHWLDLTEKSPHLFIDIRLNPVIRDAGKTSQHGFEYVKRRLNYIKAGENAFTADLPDELKLNVTGAKISQIYKRLDPTSWTDRLKPSKTHIPTIRSISTAIPNRSLISAMCQDAIVAMEECDPKAARDYLEILESDTMYCNHAEVEDKAPGHPAAPNSNQNAARFLHLLPTVTKLHFVSLLHGKRSIYLQKRFGALRSDKCCFLQIR